MVRDTDPARRSRQAIASRARAEALRCPKCGRKGAMVGVPTGDGHLKRTCRWADCGHVERVAREATI